MSNHNKKGMIPGDNPIEKVDEDLLDRKNIAANFAHHVLKLDVSKGVVVGIFAPWGHGKTSFLNLARPGFENDGVSIISFNPWVFSGTEQLVDRFFSAISSEMTEKSSLKNIGINLAKYGAKLSPTINLFSNLLGIPGIGAVADVLFSTMKETETSIENSDNLRKQLENEFKELDDPVVVVLDDIDRLSTSEIRDIFKLIRLTASFPNLIYIVLCDRTRVETALDDVNQSGRDYLEKIVQFSYDLPIVSQEILQQLLEREIERVKAIFVDIDNSETSDWSDVFREIIFPLIRNMRDIRRYVSSIHSTLFQLRNEVSVTDLLALEAIRLFLPDVFRLIPVAICDLTLTSVATSNSVHITQQMRDYHNTRLGFQFEQNEQRQSNQVSRIIEAAGVNQNVAMSALARLFWCPTKRNEVPPEEREQKESEFLQNKRVAHEYVLLQYLEYNPSDTLVDVQKALDCLTSSEQLEAHLLSLTRNRALNVLSMLRYFSTKFQEAQIKPGIIALLNVIPDLSDRELHDREAEILAKIVIARILNEHSAQEADDQTNSKLNIEHVMASVRPLNSKLAFINVIRNHKNYRTELAKQKLSILRKSLCEQILSADPDDLSKEYNLIGLLCFAKAHCEQNEEQFDSEISPIVTFAIFLGGQTISTKSELGSSHVEIAPGGEFDLKKIVTIFGSKETLRAKIFELDANFDKILPKIKSSFEIQEDYAKGLLERAKSWLDIVLNLPD